jgi:hypothetical protein
MMDLIEVKILFVDVFFFYFVYSKVSVGEAIVCILIYAYLLCPGWVGMYSLVPDFTMIGASLLITISGQ